MSKYNTEIESTLSQIIDYIGADPKYKWKDRHGEDCANHEATQALITNAKGNRIVLANCEKCGGSGILPKSTEQESTDG